MDGRSTPFMKQVFVLVQSSSIEYTMNLQLFIYIELLGDHHKQPLCSGKLIYHSGREAVDEHAMLSIHMEGTC